MAKVHGIEWAAEQVCSDCGTGVFVRKGWDDAICTDCGHMHSMDRRKLGPMERFEFKHTTQARGEQTLHVVSYF